MDAFIGQITSYGFNFIPREWAACNGALMPIASNQTLFSLLGVTYGGDGRTTFGLPDLRGRTAVNQGQAPGSNVVWRLGEQAGQERHQLTTLELPTHSHSAVFTADPAKQVQVEASTDVATSDTPAEGSYIAHNDGGRNPGVFMYRPDAGNGTVNLGGVSGGGAGGVVTVGSTGGNTPIPLFQPTLAVNYCIALTGIYPPRQ